MKKSQALIQWFDCGIFPMVVMFINGYSYDEIFRDLSGKENTEDWLLGIKNDKKLMDKAEFLTMHRTITNGIQEKELFYIYFKNEFDFSDKHMTYLAHELLHVCQFSLPDILDRDVEIEAEAYLHTFLMQNILKVLREVKK